MPQQKPVDDLPDDPITSGPGAQKPEAAAPGADESDLPDDPITSTGKRPGAPSDKPFRKELTPQQQAAQAKTDKYIQEHAPPDLWGNVGEFGGTLWEDVKGAARTGRELLRYHTPGEAWGAVVDTAKGLGKAQLDQFKKAYDAAQAGITESAQTGKVGLGHFSEAAGYAGAGLLPVLGPAAADIAEDIGAGHYGRAAARILELAGPEAFRFFKIGPVVKKLPVDPALESALTETEQAGVEQTVGQRMRNPRLQKGERNLQNFPGSEEQRAAQLQRQRGQLKARGEALAEKQSPTTPKLTQSETGGRVQDRLTQRFNRFKSAADQAYDNARAAAKLAKRRLQNGWDTQWDAKSKSWVKTKVMKDFEAPVNITQMQVNLKPVWDEFQAAFQQPARAYASPAYQKLAQLMTTTDWYMDAMDFDRTLGAIKSLTRDGNNPLLTNRSQGIAKLMIKEGEKALDDAFQKYPRIKTELDRGRRLVREYYDTAEFSHGLGKQPSDVFTFLTKAGKGSLEEIKKLRLYAPQELSQVARSYLEGMIEEGSEAGGSFERMGRMAQQFEKLDGEVQDALFGKAQAAEIKRYLDAARYLNPAEGSPTAGRLAQMMHMGEAAEAVTSLVTGVFTGHPLMGAAGAAGGVGAYYVQEYLWPRIQARLLLQPGTPRLLTQVIELPGGSKLWTRAAQTLTVRAMAMEQVVRREERERREAAGEAPRAPAAAPQAGRGGRPAEAPVGGGKGAPPAPAERKPSPLAPRTAQVAGGQEAAPSEAPTRAPGTAAASGIQTPSPTTVGGWPTSGSVPPLMPTPAGGTRPQAVAPQASPPGTPQRPAPPESQPPPGTNWRYWGMEPPAGQPDRTTPAPPGAGRPAARPPARPGAARGMARWQPVFQQVGQSAGVPPGLLATIAQLESGGNPDAVGTSGERGLMQLMPATARSLKVDPSVPEQAVRGAATLLRHLMTKYRGNLGHVLAAYNEGETAFDRRMRKGLPLPAATQNYVRRGLAILRQGGQRVQRARAGALQPIP